MHEPMCANCTSHCGFTSDYDPATRLVTTSPIAQSRQLPSLARYFKNETALAYKKREIPLRREFYSNEREAYPRHEPIALRSAEALPGDYGMTLVLASTIPDLDHFEYRETYSSDGVPDSTVKATTGSVEIRFTDPHAPRGRAKIFAFRTVGVSGAASAERTVTVWYYSREFYAAYGQSSTGVIILDDGDAPWATSLPEDWIVDRPSLEDVVFARSEWGGAVVAAERILKGLETVLQDLGLTLNEEQTRVEDAWHESFTFLGFSIRMRNGLKTGRPYPLTVPSQKARKHIRSEIKQLTTERYSAVPTEAVTESQ